jgi:hypothetical protein
MPAELKVRATEMVAAKTVLADIITQNPTVATNRWGSKKKKFK